MQLLDFYKNVLHLTDEALIDEVIRATEIKVLKRGDFLIRAGQLPTHACFLMKGIIRGTMLDCNGRDITDCIAYRCGSTVMPDNDYTQPASIALEALTDCEIICISLDVVNSLLERYPLGDKTVLSIPADLRKPSPQTEDRQLSVYCRTAV